MAWTRRVGVCIRKMSLKNVHQENRDKYMAEREFAMIVRVECELLWQGQDGWVAVSDAERPQERRQKGLRDARNSFWPWDKS